MLLSGSIFFMASIFRYIFALVLFFFSAQMLFGQKQKNRFPIWTFHVDSTNVHGLSIGAFSMGGHPDSHLTNGVKIEALGVGLIMPLIPKSPTARDSTQFLDLTSPPYSEKVNGISISVSGAANHSRVNGFLIGGMGQISTKVNGIAICAMLNFVQITNGLMISGANEAFIMNGAQLGVHNGAHYLKGFQIGAFNTVNRGNGVQIAALSASKEFHGLQIGALVETEEGSGVQIGVYNKTQTFSGVQIGIYNQCRDQKGIQIGLWNVNQRRRLPFINWNFD